jgi:hypothetical protein
MFWSDLSLMCTAEIEYKQNSGLCNVSKWRKAKKLRLNAKKTDFMLIALKNETKHLKTSKY